MILGKALGHFAFWGLCLVGCGAPAEEPIAPPEPSPTLLETPAQLEPPELTEGVLEVQAAILDTTGRDSLRRFARYADQSPGFASNFEGSRHFDHWSLLRRTGVDPLRQIETLFELPHATRTVGGEVWYIWPDFAALSSEDLQPERLLPQDRVRLLDLIGEDGVARIQAGNPYPGIRTAISAEGRWVYYLHELGQSEDNP